MKSTPYVATRRLADLALREKLADRRVPWSFDLELTARCNNACRHCYINLPANDAEAQRRELSLPEIFDIAEQAVELGALWCLLTGGEPLLRDDFVEVYMGLKKRGLLVSVFTNGCLVNEDHAALFREHPPEDIEVTVYGVTEDTYARVTRRSGSYGAFRRGLSLLLASGARIRLKAMALRSNVHELTAIATFCRAYTADYFRFDPLLHLRHDLSAARNEEIRSERLSPADIATIEQADAERATALIKGCESFIFAGPIADHACNHLFRCGVGNSHFAVSSHGVFRLCADLWHPDFTCDLRQETLAAAWNHVAPRVLQAQSFSREYLERCRVCPIVNLCIWCPAHAHLETGRTDAWVEYFCEVAHARARALGWAGVSPPPDKEAGAVNPEKTAGQGLVSS